jgi:ribosome assembly protein RRB1
VRVFRPGIDTLAPGEELEYDPRLNNLTYLHPVASSAHSLCSAYIMYHSLRTEWPCLSFDVLRDAGGDNRVRFPLTMLLACGSQADARDKNKVTLLKLSDMHKTYVSAGECFLIVTLC